jgi:DNA-binding GntR family transcriptional regulator
MAEFAVHCQDCVRILGKPYKHVHRYLDELYPYMGAIHRMVRHNETGVSQVRKRWGEEAAKAARIHIARDKHQLRD